MALLNRTARLWVILSILLLSACTAQRAAPGAPPEAAKLQLIEFYSPF